MENGEISPVAADLYFLIYKFLSGGPLTNTLQNFHDELEKLKILPKRTDWEGNRHERTIDDLDHQFPDIRPDYLLQLCCRAGLSGNSTETNNKVVTLFSLKKNTNIKEYNFKQLLDYVRRRRLVSKRNTINSCNLVNIIRGRECSGPFPRKWMVTPRLYSSLQFQRRTLGHLSAVYCLLFDYSGGFIITGADDLLIKLWSSRTGRLMNSFRGASSEITDIAINLENTLLAAGSIDRILRIWSLQTGVPIAVLPGHSGMITSVNFCPSPSWDLQYLITTSGDGSVAFWAYTYDTGGKIDFRSKPTMYQEKMRPGQAQMICSSFSPGGTFLATGSGDHHVRVYYMKGDEGPHRILETEAHSDRVDSIQWAHSGLRFLSGSKDGTAIIWSFECQMWKTLVLDMSTKTANNSLKKASEDPRKLKVTMVTWDQSDQWAITAVSDYTLKIWNAKSGQLEKVLTGHTDEVYVLEAHPHDDNVILSAGHDGQLFVWDIVKGEIVSKFTNTIENQGYGAIFDVKWSPDGTVVAASDSHGHLLIFGFGSGNKLYEQLPKDLFFHTDYRPLVRDSNHYVLDEQTQIPPHLMPPPFLVDIDGNPYPPMLQRLVPGREHCKTEQLVPSIVIGNEGTQEVIQVVAEDLPRVEGHILYNPEADDFRNNVLRTGGGSGNRRMRDPEGIRQSTGDWQNDPNMKWKRNVLVPPLKSLEIKRIREKIDEMEKLEMAEYHRQLRQRPHMITTSSVNETSKSKANAEKKKSKPPVRSIYKATVIMSSESSQESEGSDSTGYSDWMAEEDMNVRESSRTKRTRRRRVNYNSESEGDDNEEVDEEDDDDDGNNESRDTSPERSTRPQRPPPATREGKVNNIHKDSVPESYRTSEWLTEIRPRKTPYFPQMGDEVVYFPQGHQLYLDAVRLKKVYEVNTKTLPWTKMQLRSHEFVKVVGIQYEIKPPRVCNLKLALLDDEGRLTGKIIFVKYHDMPDVLDFFVLKQNFEVAMSRDWQIGDRFRCMIDDGWWVGEIISKSTATEEFPNSPFLLYEIKWDNGESERMSPWDMEPLDENRLPENTGEALPVLEEELQNILYQPNEDDWPNNNRDAVTQNILSGLSKVMELAIAEPFLVPVDLNTYPSYAMIIEYPIDLSTIRARFENHFYRRVTAAQFDVRHLATNAEKFNERHSPIVKHARILTELCLRIIKHCTTELDVSTLYHQLVDTYDSSDTEVDVEILPSSSNSRMLRSLPNRYLRHPSDWKAEAKLLFESIWDCEDSVPFRTPVNTQKYTDYHLIIKEPMDLSIVKDKLFNDKYETPHDFHNDVKLIFRNSRTYNTNQRSRIYVMTVRLAAIFEEHITKIIRNWKLAKRRTAHNESANKSGSDSSSSRSSSVSKEDDETVENHEVDNKINNSSIVEPEDSDSESDNMPLNRLQTRGPAKINESSESSDNAEEDEETASSSSSSSSSSSKKLKLVRQTRNTARREKADDSEDSYKPRRSTRKRAGPSSSSSSYSEEEDEEEENSSDSDDDRPLSQVTKLNGRTSRRVVKNYPKRRRKNSSDSDKEGGTNGDSSFFTSVSSRGRVRKLNPHVRALMKN